MSTRVVLVSYTPIDAPGGVPRWNRDFMAGFPPGSVVHYSWWEVINQLNHDLPLHEWKKAQLLSSFLLSTKRVGPDDIVIADGFWADGYNPAKTISVCHGNWSHTTASDVAKGIPPEFPDHHRAQLSFRRQFRSSGGRLVSVSDFIADQCRIQWGLDGIPVINNGIDLKKFAPPSSRLPQEPGRHLIIHGVTTTNKGFDHIDHLKNNLKGCDVVLLDEAAAAMGMEKYQALGQADLVVVPSAHEGNSYFVLESLSCGVPVVGYDVGLLYSIRDSWPDANCGIVLNRDARSPSYFLEGVKSFFDELSFSRVGVRKEFTPRQWVSQFSVENFQAQWREYLREEFGFAPDQG